MNDRTNGAGMRQRKRAISFPMMSKQIRYAKASAEPDLVRTVRVCVDLRGRLDDVAARSGASFPDEFHRLMERSFGLHDGTGILVDGMVMPLQTKWWRGKPRGPIVALRDSIASRLNAAADESGWSVGDEANSRLAKELDAETN